MAIEQQKVSDYFNFFSTEPKFNKNRFTKMEIVCICVALTIGGSLVNSEYKTHTVHSPTMQENYHFKENVAKLVTQIHTLNPKDYKFQLDSLQSHPSMTHQAYDGVIIELDKQQVFDKIRNNYRMEARVDSHEPAYYTESSSIKGVVTYKLAVPYEEIWTDLKTKEVTVTKKMADVTVDIRGKQFHITDFKFKEYFTK